MKGADIIDLASQRTLRAVAKNTLWGIEFVHSLSGLSLLQDTTYAHVLNTGLEDLWPGDVDLFYPELFACRLPDVSYLYTDTSYLAEHKRCETQRRCQPFPERLSYFDYDFFRGLQGSFPCDVVIPCEREDIDTSYWELESPPQGQKP